MSFAGDVKNELARLPEDKACCRQAELAALFRMGGTVSLGAGGLGLNFATENAAVGRRLLAALKHAGGIRAEIAVSRSRRLQKRITYFIRVPPAAAVRDLLTALGLLDAGGFNMASDAALLRRSCCRRAYLRGAFLGGGSVSRPERDYHLELVTSNAAFAGDIRRAMHSFGLNSGLTDRKQAYVVYLKDGDDIISFLRIVGATNALLKFENVRVVKDMRNQVNRLVNCETANLTKTVRAAVRQTEKIKRLVAARGLHSLPPGLQEMARLRLDHPEATLRELVTLHGGGLTRSGVNHRLRKLERLADALTDGMRVYED